MFVRSRQCSRTSHGNLSGSLSHQMKACVSIRSFIRRSPRNRRATAHHNQRLLEWPLCAQARSSGRRGGCQRVQTCERPVPFCKNDLCPFHYPWQQVFPPWLSLLHVNSLCGWRRFCHIALPSSVEGYSEKASCTDIEVQGRSFRSGRQI
jgi:hypothetical protein